MTTIHKLYWSENDVTQNMTFVDLTPLLKTAETLRKRAWAGENIRFIASASEVEESIGKQGVDVTGADYDWKKRRP